MASSLVERSDKLGRQESRSSPIVILAKRRVEEYAFTKMSERIDPS
jgi:hypothetical protein